MEKFLQGARSWFLCMDEIREFSTMMNQGISISIST